MLRYAMLTLLAGFAALSCAFSPASAGAKKPVRSDVQASESVEHRASSAYRRKPQVRGFVARRGGYSFSAADAINTYGDSRSLYGGASSYRGYQFDRQTNAGPFDHGFFFDSGIAPRGGDSPYMN
jgi:hypothetical protein